MEKITATFFYRLEKSIKTYRQFAQNTLRVHGHSITIDQWLVLRMLKDHPDVSQNDLADLIFKDKASVTRILDLLEQQKFLTRKTDPDNRRRSRLSLTPKGHKAVEAIMPIVTRYRKAALLGISEKDLLKTQAVLDRMISNCVKN